MWAPEPYQPYSDWSTDNNWKTTGQSGANLEDPWAKKEENAWPKVETVWSKEEEAGNTDSRGNQKEFLPSAGARVQIGATRESYQDKHNNREKQRESELKGDKRVQEYENALYEGYLGEEDRGIQGLRQVKAEAIPQ